VWEGEALFVLVGNCRRFTGARTAQAHVEDGLFDTQQAIDEASERAQADGYEDVNLKEIETG